MLPAGDLATRRPPLPGPTEADVAVVGGGFTGLWAAYSLVRRAPGRRVVVLEAEHAGFGASGRNGGWVSGLLPVSLDAVAAASSRAAALALQGAAAATVEEVWAVAAAEGIDAQADKGGYLRLATTQPQVARLRAAVAQAREQG